MSKQNTVSLCIVYAFVFLAIGTAPLLAQVTVEPGEPVTVNLTAGGPVELVYTVDKPQTVTITARSLEAPDQIDTTLEVLGGDGRRLPGGFNDDRGSDGDGLLATDSVISGLALPVPGTYTLRLNSFNGASKGQVEVTVQPVDRFETVVTETPGHRVITARLPAFAQFTYEIDAAAGDVLDIVARDVSGTLDPLLAVYDSDGVMLAGNDDHVSPSVTLDTFDAHIESLTIPVSGRYTITVWDFTGRAGVFELVVVIEET